MHALFGVEPAAINNWQNMRYVIEKFGMSRGALIAQIPKKWPALVLDECRRNPNVKDIERARIEEALRHAKNDKLFRPQVHFEPEQSWTENILGEEISGLLQGVIISSEPLSETCFNVDDLPNDVFENFGQTRVKQTAEALADVARFVLANAEAIILIDPYFQPARRCIKVLKSIISVASSYNSKLKSVFIFSAASKCNKSDDLIHDEYRAAIEAFDAKGITYHIIRLDDGVIDMDMHARYLLTPDAGLVYDRGFQEPEDIGKREHLTPVSCLVQRLHSELREEFSLDNPQLSVAQHFFIET
ncbi:hypothetical protein J6I90_12275 [Pseudidiomarina sp. 1APP75-32.1]|uniref:Uncharacterized protein n=1 Tax=Pseudidiomarina terrestris TaxID=2820060 RepID=A0AAW7R567_9GAMM|nr:MULTISPECIES: hypothetical protein [unclassified Pseudidiomarina]MDN7125659.1 hypothetical protein [Pseudidiomarina sp. 1APP75-32.1]MDN7130477.1 hypothetical protein [Pseudidiomarina sp. 1APR75-15]